MATRTILDRIQRLDPERDHREIVFLDACYEFPFDVTRADEFALFRTFAVPSIATLLAQTGEFERRAQKRYDDTRLIVSEFVEHGYDSERGRAAIRRMNQIHRRFPIANDDYLYVLSTFVFEPIRWIERYGWRPLAEQERLATFYFWRTVAQRMNIKEVPADYETFERFNRAYERANFRPCDACHRVASATRDLFLGWFLPPPLWPLGRPALHAMMDDPLLEACGFPKPSPALRRAVQGSLRARSRLVRQLPERRTPYLRTERRSRTYPRGYRIEALGPDGTTTPPDLPHRDREGTDV